MEKTETHGYSHLDPVCSSTLVPRIKNSVNETNKRLGVTAAWGLMRIYASYRRKAFCIMLDRQYSTYYILYCCTNCDEKFSSQDGLKEHIKNCISSVDTSWIKQEHEVEGFSTAEDTAPCDTPTDNDSLSQITVKTEDCSDNTLVFVNSEGPLHKSKFQDSLHSRYHDAKKQKTASEILKGMFEQSLHDLFEKGIQGDTLEAGGEFSRKEREELNPREQADGSSGGLCHTISLVPSSVVTSLSNAASVVKSASCRRRGSKHNRHLSSTISGGSMENSSNPQFSSVQFIQESNDDPSLPKIERVYYTSLPVIAPKRPAPVVPTTTFTSSGQVITTKTLDASVQELSQNLSQTLSKSVDPAYAYLSASSDLTFSIPLMSGHSQSTNSALTMTAPNFIFKGNTGQLESSTVVTKLHPNKQKLINSTLQTSMVSPVPMVHSSVASVRPHKPPVMAVLPQANTPATAQPVTSSAVTSLTTSQLSFPTPMQNIGFPSTAVGQLAYPYMFPLVQTGGGVILLPPTGQIATVVSQPQVSKTGTVDQLPQTFGQQMASTMIRANVPGQLPGMPVQPNLLFLPPVPSPGNVVPPVVSSAHVMPSVFSSVSMMNTTGIQKPSFVNQGMVLQSTDMMGRQMIAGVQAPGIMPLNAAGTCPAPISGALSLNTPGVGPVSGAGSVSLNIPGSFPVSTFSACSTVMSRKCAPLDSFNTGTFTSNSLAGQSVTVGVNATHQKQKVNTDIRIKTPPTSAAANKKNLGKKVLLLPASSSSATSSLQSHPIKQSITFLDSVHPIRLADGMVLVPVFYFGPWTLDEEVCKGAQSAMETLLKTTGNTYKPGEILNVVGSSERHAPGHPKNKAVTAFIRPAKGNDCQWVLLGEDGAKIVWAPDQKTSKTAVVIPVLKLPDDVTRQIQESMNKVKEFVKPGKFALIPASPGFLSKRGDGENSIMRKSVAKSALTVQVGDKNKGVPENGESGKTVQGKKNTSLVKPPQKIDREETVNLQKQTKLSKPKRKRRGKVCAAERETCAQQKKTQVHGKSGGLEGTRPSVETTEKQAKSSREEKMNNCCNEPCNNQITAKHKVNKMMSETTDQECGKKCEISGDPQQQERKNRGKIRMEQEKKSFHEKCLPKGRIPDNKERKKLKRFRIEREKMLISFHKKCLPILPKGGMGMVPFMPPVHQQWLGQLHPVNPTQLGISSSSGPRLTVHVDPVVVKHALDAVVRVDKLTLAQISHLDYKKPLEEMLVSESVKLKDSGKLKRKLNGHSEVKEGPESCSGMVTEVLKLKRKRGRPRKYPLAEEGSDGSTVTMDEERVRERSSDGSLRRSLRIFLKPQPDYSVLENQELDELLEDIKPVVHASTGTAGTIGGCFHTVDDGVRTEDFSVYKDRHLDDCVSQPWDNPVPSGSKSLGIHAGYDVYVERGDDDQVTVKMEPDADGSGDEQSDEDFEITLNIKSQDLFLQKRASKFQMLSGEDSEQVQKDVSDGDAESAGDKKSGVTYQCNVCDSRCMSKTILISHLLLHEKGPFSCKTCPFEAATTTQLREHRALEHTGNPLYTCNVCGNTFFSYSVFTKHLNRHK